MGLNRIKFSGDEVGPQDKQRVALRVSEQILMHDPLAPSNLVMGALAEEAGMLELAKRFWRTVAEGGDADHAATARRYLESSPEPGCEAVTLWVRGCLSFFSGRILEARDLLMQAASQAADETLVLHLARSMVAAGNDDHEIANLLSEFLGKTTSGGRRNELIVELAGATFRLGLSDAAATTSLVAEVVASERSANADWLAEVRNARDTELTRRPEIEDYYHDPKVLHSEWHRTQSHLVYKSSAESFITFSHADIRQELLQLLDRSQAKQLLDFGVFNARNLYALSELRPMLNFIGVDRVQYIRDLNKQYQRSNLEIRIGNIIDILDTLAVPQETILMHAKTGLFLYPRALQEHTKSASVLAYRLSPFLKIGESVAKPAGSQHNHGGRRRFRGQAYYMTMPHTCGMQITTSRSIELHRTRYFSRARPWLPRTVIMRWPYTLACKIVSHKVSGQH